MNYWLKNCAGVLCICFCLFSAAYRANAKGNKDENGRLTALNNLAVNPPSRNPANSDPAEEFEWSKHNKLSWDDFRGSSNTANSEAAAATHCSIGLKLCKTDNSDKAGIIVYNNFYTNKSWVKPNAKIPEILNHEQGHFDLCEIYTRKLRMQVGNIDANSSNIRSVLQLVYSKVKNEYENRQQAYEKETIHGTDLAQQQKWLNAIAMELK